MVTKGLEREQRSRKIENLLKRSLCRILFHTGMSHRTEFSIIIKIGKRINSMFTGPQQWGKQENQVACKCTQVCRRENISLFKGTHYPALMNAAMRKCESQSWPEELKIGYSPFFFFLVTVILWNVLIFKYYSLVVLKQCGQTTHTCRLCARGCSLVNFVRKAIDI